MIAFPSRAQGKFSAGKFRCRLQCFKSAPRWLFRPGTPRNSHCRTPARARLGGRPVSEMPRTALQWASLDGDALRVRWLLSSGENPNADDWVRPLSLALALSPSPSPSLAHRPRRGYCSAACRPRPPCLAHCAVVSRRWGKLWLTGLAGDAQSGRTALHYGCKKGHATVVRLVCRAFPFLPHLRMQN